MTKFSVYAATIVLIGSSIAGCTVSEVIAPQETTLEVATLNVAESLLLDVGIVNFDTGISDKNDPVKTGVYPEVRMAEARYIPYHLKTTMQGTGYWGAVRVIPSRYVFTDVTVSGEIEKSDGEFVELRIRVEDSLGRQWYERDYSMQTGIISYAEYRDRTQDPYQKVMNDVANDLHTYAASLDPQEIRRMRQVSELRFFGDMVPGAFDEYLATDDKGMVSVVRLPAENDPMVDRLRQVRERDRLVIDTLNEHYANFYYGIALPYEGWRRTSREQAVAYRQTRRSAAMRALLGVVVVAGSMQIDTGGSHSRAKQATQYVGINRGLGAIYDAWAMRSSANIHRENIRELSESFVAEAAPLVIQVEGESRRLTGTAESQYESWRKLLKEIYQAETGFAQEIELGVPARAAEPTG
ncbi:MAG: hypothetical protein OEW68_11855 [Gammaproteobacteria bacterium]|nr:hypothetical protein [Gammaproteobacteria bacterium]MDH4315528.1 hypothetical protein [Gammaproteobacteria bacterium]MDH5215856.1 hypothetical protein [Gammaproteobacteria bacterium]